MATAVTDDRDRMRYEISEDGRPVGFVTYRLRPDLIELVHTQIDRDREGHGLAAVLVGNVLDDARSRGLSVLPFCPYVATFIGEHADEYLELVPAERRHQFGLAD
jgi:hypothetical protein